MYFESKFKTKNDLDYLRSIATDKTQKMRLSANIREAAEASKSEHLDIDGNIDREIFLEVTIAVVIFNARCLMISFS